MKPHTGLKGMLSLEMHEHSHSELIFNELAYVEYATFWVIVSALW